MVDVRSAWDVWHLVPHIRDFRGNLRESPSPVYGKEVRSYSVPDTPPTPDNPKQLT
jgi:hypothetical protein